jgi:xanthine dehydrogenase accessory factor
MKDYLKIIDAWLANKTNMVLARVIKTWGSSPRPIGAVMLINDEFKITGSVSGGCIEGTVVKMSKNILNHRTAEKLNFGVSDEEAWSVGLSCGGNIQVFLQSVDFSYDPVWKTLLSNTRENKSSILITLLENGQNQNSLLDEGGTLIGSPLPNVVIAEAEKAYTERMHKTVSHEGADYFIQIFPRKNTLLIIGVAHIAVDLVALADRFGFETMVIDPRGYFAQNTVFDIAPTKILEAYPSEVLHQFKLDPYTFCTILSHDSKIDDNALEILLPSKVGYIGALGSKKTHDKRVARLLQKGISKELISKIQAPIGVSINAQSAQEIALAIMGQIIQFKNQYSSSK